MHTTYNYLILRYTDTERPRGAVLLFGLYKILFHFEALLHNNIFCKHPLYCAIYCTILPVYQLLHPPAKI